MRDETKPMRILLCEDSLEGILTGVYEAYKSRYGHDNIKLCLDSEEYEIEMFSEYQKMQKARIRCCFRFWKKSGILPEKI